MKCLAVALGLFMVLGLFGCGGSKAGSGGTTANNISVGNGATTGSSGTTASTGSTGTTASTGSTGSGSTSGSTGAPGVNQLEQVPGAQLMGDTSHSAELRQAPGTLPTMSSPHFRAKLGVVPPTAP